MKNAPLLFLIYYINLVSGFLKFHEKNEPSKKFVSMAAVSSSQEFDDSKVKLIETNFNMSYSAFPHFDHSNSPVAPRTDGGYYIAFTDTSKYLHVLSYNKFDKLLRDFNIREKAYPVDITATENGFAIYALEADSGYHSYLSLYNKTYKLVKKVEIMNNSKNDNKTIDSNLKKQIIRYRGSLPTFGMRFMYAPDSGKLIYSGGRIFLIFSHYNYFKEKEGWWGHTGDTSVTFNKNLKDMDFGVTWGASHSLIQSATADANYFWTAALSDGYPMGVKVVYTSKTKFQNSYDSVNKKNNQREYKQIHDLAGKITGYHDGNSDGKLGGILYFEKLKIYCLVYAKTPNASQDNYNGKNVIYMTTWKFENEKIVNNKTTIIRAFSGTEYISQVRAGKFGDDKVFITYSFVSNKNDQYYVLKGVIPNFALIDVSNSKKIKVNVKHNKLLMNTNEDLRTFGDGVLIWATANKDGKLSIIKIGTVNY